MRLKKTDKTPWYIWFSFIAFAFLWRDTMRRIKFFRESFWDNFELWAKACLNAFMLGILHIVIPIIAYGVLANRLISGLPDTSIVPEIAISGLLLLIYFSNVYATYRHMAWRRANISHLLDSKLPTRSNLITHIFRKSSKTQKWHGRGPNDN